MKAQTVNEALQARWYPFSSTAFVCHVNNLAVAATRPEVWAEAGTVRAWPASGGADRPRARRDEL